jgi:hypothetical protein
MIRQALQSGDVAERGESVAAARAVHTMQAAPIQALATSVATRARPRISAATLRHGGARSRVCDPSSWLAPYSKQPW